VEIDDDRAMAGATNGNGGGGKVISMPLQYFCVLAAAVVAVMVLSLSFMSPAAMVAVRHNLGSSVAAAAPGSSSSTASSGAAAGGLAAASPPVARKEKEQARRRPPVVLFNFGDSNSDTGGVAAAGGIRIMPPEGRTYFHHPTGRLSDGRVILDFICESLSLLPGSGWFKSPVPPRFDSIQHSPFFLACSSNSPRCSVLGRRPSRRRAQRHSPRRRAVLVGLRLAAALARVIQD